MIRLGLIGRDISHSKSQAMYQKILNTEIDYHLLDYLDADSIPNLKTLFFEGFLGLSITFPYKKHFFNDVVIEDENIKELGAINCVREFQGRFEATNTDYLAAKWLLDNNYSDFEDIYVLGSGNMSRVFQSALNSNSVGYQVFSRKLHGDLNSLDFDKLMIKGKKSLIINCCSRDFVFTANLPESTTFWDMNYSFSEHNHLKNKKVRYVEGLDLLEWQAKFALRFWKISQPKNS